MSFAKCLVLVLSVVASVNALATPHAIRHSVHHRSIAARAAEPRSANVPVAPLAARAPANRRRCRPRPTSSSSAGVTPSTSVPINAAPIPSTSDAVTTSSTRAPEPTTSSTRPPTTRADPTTSSTRRPTTTSQPPATTSRPSNNGGGGGGNGGFLAGIQSGQGTFYDTGLGACGRTNRDTDFIAAVSMHLFDNYPGYNKVNPNNNPVCGKQIRASRNGASAVITVVDRCVGCALTDLDFSPAAFDALTGGNRGLGRVQITWEWI